MNGRDKRRKAKKLREQSDLVKGNNTKVSRDTVAQADLPPQEPPTAPELIPMQITSMRVVEVDHSAWIPGKPLK